MDSRVIEAMRADAKLGIDAVQRGRGDQASVLFTKALDKAGGIQDAKTRRDETSALGGLFAHMGFPDLAVMAYEEALELDKLLGVQGKWALDTLELGHAHTAMDNEGEAERLYRAALEVFLEENDFASAASASSSIAGFVANRGDVATGIAMLHESLGYLARKPFREAEVQTRFALLRLYEHADHDLDASVANARELWTRFADGLRTEHRSAARTITRQLIGRYAKAFPGADLDVWARQNFPMLGP